MDKTEVEKLAELARLELTQEETMTLAAEVGAILGYVSEIQAVSAAVPMPEAGEHRNIVRKDGAAHEPGVFTEDVLANAPNRDGAYIKVKRIITNE